MANEGRRSATVLVADDDEAQREVVREVLLAEGYDVLVAESPEEVLAHLGRRPDVLMLDWHGIATPEVSRALAALEPRPGIVLFSGEAQLQRATRELGADVGLPKPSDLDELLVAVQQALAARAARVNKGASAPAPSHT